MPRMGKTEEDWNGLKLGFLKIVQPNSFSKLICAVCNFKNNAQESYFVCLESLIFSFPWNFFAHCKFHSDWGRVIGQIDTAPLMHVSSACPWVDPGPTRGIVKWVEQSWGFPPGVGEFNKTKSPGSSASQRKIPLISTSYKWDSLDGGGVFEILRICVSLGEAI